MESKGLRFVRYADDFSIYCKSKQEARKQGNDIYLFLKNKLKLPINKQKSGIRRPKDFSILGYAFVPTYEKGVKGKYQPVVEPKRWKTENLNLWMAGLEIESATVYGATGRSPNVNGKTS